MQKDPRFAQIQPLLTQIQQRLGTFVEQESARMRTNMAAAKESRLDFLTLPGSHEISLLVFARISYSALITIALPKEHVPTPASSGFTAYFAGGSSFHCAYYSEQ